MNGFASAVLSALTAYAARITGIQPEWKPSKKAHLASGSFLRSNAEAAAAALHARRAECTLSGAPLLASVTTENGWLLVFFTADAIDAFAATLPETAEPDDSYLSRRLWAMARRPDAKTPDDPALLDGFYALLFSAPNGTERFLSAPRAHDGNERVAIEQRRTRMARVLLFEQMQNVECKEGSNMKLTWLGHSTFVITNDAGGVLVTDPVDAGSGFDLPRVTADVITVSHHHFDHDAVERIGGNPVVKDTPEPVEIAGFRITGYPAFHDEVRGAKRGPNILFSIEADGQRFVHCGDLGHVPDEATLGALSGCDVLMLPVGGIFTVDGKTAWAIAKRVAPKTVVPMHYAVPELTFGLEPLDRFLQAAKADPAPVQIEIPVRRRTD